MWMLLVAALARAAPLVLPADEDPAAWAHALEISGLEAASPPSSGPWVALVHEGAAWTLEIHGSEVERTVPVAAPESAAGRDAVAVLAASLLRPVEVGPALPPVGTARQTPPPRRAKPPPPAEVAAEPPPPPKAETQHVLRLGLFNRPEPEQLDGAIDLVEPETARVEVPARWVPWVRASGGLAWRSGTELAPVAAVTGGAAHGALRGGAGVAVLPDVGLSGMDGRRDLRVADAWLGGWIAPPQSAGVGALAGLSRRAWMADGAHVASTTTGFAGAEITGRIPVGPVEISPIARVTLDLAQTTVLVGSEPALDFGAAQTCLEIAVMTRAGRR